MLLFSAWVSVVTKNIPRPDIYLSMSPPSSFRRSVPGVGEARGAVQHGARHRLHLGQSVRGHHAHAGEQRQHFHQGMKEGKQTMDNGEIELFFLTPFVA